MATSNDAFIEILNALGLTKREIGGALLPKITGMEVPSLSGNVPPGKFSHIPILNDSIPVKMVPLISDIHHCLWCGRGYFLKDNANCPNCGSPGV